MTETAIAANLCMTPLAASPAIAALTPQLVAYRGALSPRHLDAPEREMAALTTGAAVHDLGWLQRVSVTGEDRFRWLNGMVTNSVNDLASMTGAWNLVLNAQGRIQGELYLWRNQDALELEIAADQIDKLLAHFDRFIIMDDVELVRQQGQTALGLSGPRAADVLAKLGLPVLAEPLSFRETFWNGKSLRLVRGYGLLVDHYQLWIDTPETCSLWGALREAGAVAVGVEAQEALRIAEAIPTYGIDMVERDLPQETDQMRALHFAKGCYLGQEIVERIRSRGSVHRHLRQMQWEGPLPVPGVELHFENAAGADAVAGTITSAVELPLGPGRRIALGVVRAEAELRKQPFTYTVGEVTGTARVLTAPPSLNS
jgi:folate-binding protein YgfZ